MSDETQPPIIYWIKGVSVDDPNAEMVFKGFRYWNESQGEYRQFFDSYQGRAVVADLQQPNIAISGLVSEDEGRYWCMVAEWSGRQQEGTDADGMAVMIDGPKSYVTSIQVDNDVTINIGDDATIECMGNGIFDTVTWYEGPFHLPDSENFTHTEIGTFTKVGTKLIYNNNLVLMEPGFTNMHIDSFFGLNVQNAQMENAGRYWCELSLSTAVNEELQTDRSSTLLVIQSPPFSCDNKAPGQYPDPDDCSMYYECVSGNPITYHRSCGYDGLVFNSVENYCDWAANVPPPCRRAADKKSIENRINQRGNETIKLLYS
uniref:chitinase n=1 Tax=Ciona savignyi TaxID=51511 RepID=H2YR39_CIOSA